MINLRVATSYFYHVRFFRPYMVPISTAAWDPKWYHNFKGQDHVYIDKNGIVNGLRLSPLRPGESCADLCRGPENCATKDPKTCQFLLNYRKQLDAINFDQFMENLDKSVRKVLEMTHCDMDPIAVLLFHEVTDNPCSERVVVQDWFRNHGQYLCELMYPVQNYY